MMAELVRGKVAQIISERSLAINRGLDHGVRTGMRFVVLGPPAEIVDPETSEKLGAIERQKVSVRVTTVAPKFSICDTYALSLGFDILSGGFQDIFKATPSPTLKVKDSAYVAPLSPDESYVEIGDEVRQVPEPPSPPRAKRE